MRWMILAVLMCVSTAFAQEAPPAPAGPSGYGQEEYRLIGEKDEIVAVLKNGATVIVKRVPSSPAVSVRGYVYTGGIYEGQWLGGGLSHLLEHLVAGGSSKKRTEQQNNELLQELGKNSNAYTTYDHTCYFINTTPENVDPAIDLLTGWLLGALITPEEYAREYEVVQRELEMGKGEPDRQFFLMSIANRYRVHPIRVPVIGYQEVIQGLSRDDVYSYYKLTYQPNNLVFSIAGNIDPEKTLAAVRKHLDAAPPGRVPSRDLADEPAVQGPRSVIGTFPQLGQARLQIGFPSIKLDHPDLYALDLLAATFSAGESSLLIEEIRDKQRLVSSIGASSWTPNYVEGEFSIDMQLDPDKIPAATKAVLELIEDVKKNGVSDGRVERAKTRVKAGHVRGKQTAENIAADLATNYMSTGDPHFQDNYVARIEAVKPTAMADMARKYLNTDYLITTVMLPAEYVGAVGLPKAEDLIRPVLPAETAKSTATDSEVQRVVLDNGTVLLIKRITTTPLVAMNMYSIGGLTTEDIKTNGIGALTMDLTTRGTKSRSAKEIAEFMDSTGSSVGASCGNQTWYWNASCLKDEFDKTMEVYADIVKNPTFPESELAIFKQRTLAAIEDQDSDWTGQAFRYFKKSYFGPSNSPYQFNTIGQKEVVEALTPKALAEWYTEKVLPSPRVLAIYGDVDVEHAKELASKYFGELPKTTPPTKSIPAGIAVSAEAAEKATIVIDRVEVQKTQQPLAGLVIGFDAKPIIGEPSTFPILVADTLSSGYGYPTGYLHEILRGRGLVYVIHAQNMPGRSAELPGTFMVYAGCDPRQINTVVDLTLENIARLQGDAKAIDETWFTRGKQLITTSDALDNETASEQATTAALDELYGLGFDHHTKFADSIRGVALEDVQKVARTRLIKCVVTISTPAPELVKVEKGTRTYNSFDPVDLTPRGVEHAAPGAQ